MNSPRPATVLTYLGPIGNVAGGRQAPSHRWGLTKDGYGPRKPQGS